MIKFNKNKWGLVVLLVILLFNSSKAQLSFSGQIRTRSEFRNGQGSPLSQKINPAFFTSQRSRLGFSFNTYRLKTSLILQDVRVWGQDASTNNRTTNSDLNGAMIHEAYTEISLLDTVQKHKELTLKIGRQELNYDDARLLGNLDWLQQARRHDVALLKYATPSGLIHAGFAFNQNKELKSETIYNGTPIGYSAGTNGIGTLYKSLQFIYAKKGGLSVLILKDDFNKYAVENQAKVFQNGVWSRITLGGNYTKSIKKNQLKGEAYYQTGKDKTGFEISSYLFSAQSLQQLSKQINIGIGYDFTSGNEPNSIKNNAFDPLYGTPHKFWGLMDYFYVADGFGKSGLSDLYLRGKFKANQKLSTSLDIHQFNATNSLIEKNVDGISTNLKSSLGQEIDLMFQYTLTKNVSFEAAYCLFETTDTLNSSVAKNIKNPKKYADWAYIMINTKF